MRPAVREMARTVHPELAGAVLTALARHAGPSPLPSSLPSSLQQQPPFQPPGPAETEAGRLLADGAAVPEALHRELLAALHVRGRAAVLDAGRALFERPRDPLLRGLMAAPDVPALLARARPVEPWLYAGHRTRSTLRTGELTVRHLAYLGRPPALAETLFVCAVHTAAVAAVTGRPVDATLLAADRP
ncbi:hypothetical protein, partial [Kitasatospora sp. NPDC047058]|uniref:hypothetical protein n=1 Tax=Kitasatospora sp. NPDC047058 TaxID=3155620 RepID=UPI0034117CBD